MKDIIDKLQNEQTDDFARKNFIEVIMAARQDHLNADEIIGNVLTLLLAGQDNSQHAIVVHVLFIQKPSNSGFHVRRSQQLSLGSKQEQDWYLPDKNDVGSRRILSKRFCAFEHLPQLCSSVPARCRKWRKKNHSESE